MAVKIVQKGKTTISAANLLKTFQKDMGEEIGTFGGKLQNATRIPTGLFPLDLALGGGIPRGKVTLIFGPESSNKTNLALLAIASHQKMFPDKTNVFIDVENSWDPEWAALLGVDVEKVIVIQPDYAEQAVDLVENFMLTSDCGIVVVDSLAALMSTSEAESSADKAVVGGASLVIGKLTRRTTQAFRTAEKQGNTPTLIYINQISYKIGVMFGDPETQPGGKKPLFQASIMLRCYGKDLVDKKVSTMMPIGKDVTFIIRKHKVPILRKTGEFQMATMPYKGLKIGQCDDFNQVKGYLDAYGQFEKAEKGKKGWMICGDHYEVIDQFREKLYKDFEFGNGIRQAIIERIKSEGMIEPGEDADGDSDG